MFGRDRPAPRMEHRSDLGPANEDAAARTDALQAPGGCPPRQRAAADGHIRRGEDVSCFCEADPVGGDAGHRQVPCPSDEPRDREADLGSWPRRDPLVEPDDDRSEPWPALVFGFSAVGADSVGRAALSAELPAPVVAVSGAGLAPPAPAPSADPSPPESALPPDASCPEEDDGRALTRASFFAQPEPLKTTLGADGALRSRPPQVSHVVGPADDMLWTTSVRRPHEPQT